MRHLARHLAVCVALVGSVAQAAPRHHHHKVTAKKKKAHKHHVRPVHRDDESTDSDEVAVAEQPDAELDVGEATRSADDEDIDAPAKVTKHAPKRATDW